MSMGWKMKILRIVIGEILLCSFAINLAFPFQNSSDKFYDEDFFGYVYVGDLDPIPDLDFVIVTNKLPDQSRLHYKAFEYYVRVFRKSNPKHFDTIEKIRSEINRRWLEANNKVKVHVFGRYSEALLKTQGRCDAFLELVAIWIFEDIGHGKGYAIEGVIGEVGSYGILPGRIEKEK
jgi:hypothetical protein